MTHAQPAGRNRRSRRSRRAEAQDAARQQALAGSSARLPALAMVVALVAAVVAGGLLGERRARPDVVAAGDQPADLGPVAPGADAAGSTWYCAGGTGSEGGAAHEVHLANPGDEPIDVSLTVMAGAARGEAVSVEPVTEAMEVPATSSLSVLLSDIVDAPLLAAVVETGPGEVAVEHSIAGETDGGLTPCASSASSTWHLAAGTTTRDAVEQLILFNPFPDDAVVDVTFATPDGLRSPPAFSGLIVAGRRVLAVDVGAVVSRHPNVATSIIARTGRLVVDRIQRFDGTDGPAGLDLTGAAASSALVWHFPEGFLDEDVSEVVTVYNPSEQQAEVDVEVALDPSSDPAAPLAAEPFQLSIAPLQFAQVVVADDGRVPLDRGHSLTVRSQNGVAVVAERWLRAAAPALGPGLAATLGSPLLSSRWMAASGSTEGGREYLVVANPGVEGIARLAVSSLSSRGAGGLGELGDLEVGPASRVVIDLSDHLGEEPLVLVVQSTLPVVVERVLFGAGGGRSHSLLVPAGPQAVVAQVEVGELPAGPLPTVATTSSTSTTSTSTSTTTVTSTLAVEPTTTLAPVP